MDSSSKHAERAKRLVEAPERYDELKAEYSNEWKYYRSLRNAAPEELATFDEYVELHRIFFERESRRQIRAQVEQWLPRSVKNMVLGSSKRGRAYRISTLQEVNERLKTYDELGLATPDLYEQIQTILEALYDDDWNDAHSILDDLLDDTPNGASKTIELVARVRVALAVRDAEDTSAVHQAIVEYVETVDPPLSDAPSTASECTRKASQLPYDDPQKEDLYAAALHQNPRNGDAFVNYLYLSAREYVERYRHEGEDPSRALLAVAFLQFTVLDEVNWFKTDATQDAWIASYEQVAYAILVSGGRWGSDRENWPEPDFLAAASSYASAATLVRTVHDGRFLKYVSKSFRHAAHEAFDWELRRELHADAIELILRLSAEIGEDDAVVTGQELVRYHKLRRTEASMHVNFDLGEYEAVVDQYHDFAELRENIHRPIKTGEVHQMYDLSKARTAEKEGEYERARGLYNLVDDDRAAERAVFCKVKEHVENGETAEAERCLDEFGQSHPTVATAVAILSGGRPDVSKASVEGEPFLAETQDDRTLLQTLVRLGVGSDPAFFEIEPVLKERLLAL